jgi:hypothetical protein
MKRFLLILLLFGCGSPDTEVVDIQEIDTLFVNSDSIAKQALTVLPKADKQVEKLIERIEVRIENLKTEVVKSQSVKTIVIRDTIYITEKKNFWGKKKVTVDSSEHVSIDSTKIN